MKKVLVILLLLIATATSVVAQDAIFRRYAKRPNIQAAYIERFHLSDSQQTNVTTLRATNSNGWTSLLHEFNIPIVSDTLERPISIRIAPRTNSKPHQSNHIQQSDIIIASHREHTLCIFHINNEIQYEMMLDRFFDYIDN